MINFARPSLKLSRKLALTFVDGKSFLSVHFSRFLSDELFEDLRHSCVHSVNSFSSTSLFQFTFFLLAFLLLVDSTLNHSAAHLDKLLLLFFSYSGLQVVELVLVLLA